MSKIRCICPCCGQEKYVSVEEFNALQKYALTYQTIVTVLPDEEDEEKE